MRDINDVVSLTSVRSKYPETTVGIILRFYYEDIRYALQEKSYSFINLGGFGRLYFNFPILPSYIKIKVNSIIRAELRLANPDKKYPMNTTVQTETILRSTRDIDQAYELYMILKDKTKFTKRNDYHVQKVELNLKKLLVTTEERLLPKGLKDNQLQREYLQQLPE